MAEKLDCNELKIKIENLTNLISTYSVLAISNKTYASQITNWKQILEGLKLDYDTNGCMVKLEQERQQDVKEVGDKYKELDKIRIEEESKYNIRKRVFYGSLILLSVLGIIIIMKEK